MSDETTMTETTTTTTKKPKKPARPPAFSLIITGGDTDSDGDIDVRVTASILDRVVLDLHHELDAVSAMRRAATLISMARRTFGRLIPG